MGELDFGNVLGREGGDEVVVVRVGRDGGCVVVFVEWGEDVGEGVCWGDGGIGGGGVLMGVVGCG